jgi:hypothetical protein
MKPALRSILAVLSGLVVAAILIGGIEAVSSKVYPPPAGLDVNTRAALADYVKTMPTGAFLFVLAAWAFGSFAGAWVAARIAGRQPLVHGGVLGGILLCAGIANMLRLPHPAWMWVAGVAIFVGCSYAGAAISQTSSAISPPAAHAETA